MTMSSSWCTSCCGSCFASSPSTLTSISPFALRHLLALGTLLIKLPVEIEHQICDHTHAEDGWHYFRAKTIIPRLSDPDDLTVCRALDYLVRGHFITATYHSNVIGLMDVRIYLIPYDLSDVQGKLRLRKESVLAPARRYLRDLFPRISQDLDRWKGLRSTGDATILPLAKDPRTLAEIYSDLVSPCAVPIPGYGDIASRLLDLNDDLDGFGMRSKLYTYQRRSVAAMLQKELDLQDVPDPLYIQVHTVHQKPFFLQPGTMEVLQERPLSATCRGGILCEELGTGKTIMMLSLIVATRHQLSSPEPSLIDDHPVMTPVAYRHFPSSNFASARKRAGFSNTGLTQSGSNVPSLVELLLHHARTDPYCNIAANSLRHEQWLAKEDVVSNLPLAQVIRANVPFYHQYLGEPTNRERGQRRTPPRTPKVMHLTSATLIVVPANLISQWDREITRHCAVPLRVLIIRVKTRTPSARSLATDYDIILMSYTRFATEAQNAKVLKLHTQPPCECPEFKGFRVPNCHCEITDVSPFLQIRWKRLIIDEGHVSATLSTTLVPFTKLLSFERRWIVTGTPTTNLLGLSLGSKVVSEQGIEARMPVPEDSDIVMNSPSLSSNSSRSSPLPPSPSASIAASLPSPDDARIWTQDDRIDMLKLGNMISHFIAVPQFSAEPKLIASRVVEPLLDPSGPRPGAIQVLNQVMQMVMIRHRIEDVEKDVVLPPVSQESVLLDLDPYVMKSFNALQANILINAVDSERRHQDYMFHPHNADKLQNTMINMSQILFWHVNPDLYYAKELTKNEDATINRAIERQMPEEDIRGLREAFKHIQLAIEDPLWKSFQFHEDVPYRAYDLKERVYEAWTRTPGKEPNSDPTQTGFLHADRILKLHKMVIDKPLIKEDRMIEYAKVVVKSDLIFRETFEKAERKKEKNKGQKKAKSTDESLSASQLKDNFAKKASDAETLAEMQKDLKATMARLEREEAEENGELMGPSQVAQSPSKKPSSLIASSLLAKMHIGSSASSKLNFIINEVQQYSATEKFLIFSESALSLAHVSEALEIMHVKFLRFTTQVTPQIREQLVLTFETSETYRVFLMELKHGARGLNLVSASRIIFCEPVWQADVESQAVKRAHRIGQTRPITVKTLAIRQTAEENMVARKAVLRNSHEKLPKLLEEAGMRYYIANPKFITHSPSLTPINKFPLVDLPPELLQPRPGAVVLKIPALPITSPSRKRVRVQDPIIESNPIEEGFSGEESQPPKKKKRAVAIRFATP